MTSSFTTPTKPALFNEGTSFLVVWHHSGSTLFPTRRSSDLTTSKRASVPARASTCVRRHCRTMPCAPRHSSPSRSEEHTSELQSQFHLVCRPLLEKKNDLQTKY